MTRTSQRRQWRKCRSPVNTMAMPCPSAAAITSSSRTLPPGWITAATPAATTASRPSRNGKKASLAQTPPATRSPARVSGDARRIEAVLLSGADAESLALVGEHDGVGRDRRADDPGELEVQPLLIAGRRRGDDPPRAAVRADRVGLLDEQSTVDRADVERQLRPGNERRQQAQVVLRRERRQRRRFVVGGHDDLGEHGSQARQPSTR